MLLITTTGRREAFAQEAYEQGCDQTEAEYKEALEDKDAFIGVQAELIQQLVERDLIRWERIPTGDELLGQLASYV